MKNAIAATGAALALLMTTSLTSCDNKKAPDEAGDADFIDRPSWPAPADGQKAPFTIDALEALGRVDGLSLSPDGKTALFSVSFESVEQNKSNADVYTVAVDSPLDVKRLTRTKASEQGAVFTPDGKHIAFIYPGDKDDNNTPQLWLMNPDGSGRVQVTNLEKGIEGFLFAPDMKHVLLVQTVKYARTAGDVYPDLAKSTGRIIDDLMYKHWDEWVTEIPHPMLASFDGKDIDADNIVDILADEPFESPMRPWGGVESFAWAPDSKSLVYTCRKKTGMDYSLSTNSDLYLYTLDSDAPVRNLTEGNLGYDTAPAFSPDGTRLAWLSMEHDGYESDKNRIMMLDMASGEKTDLTTDWDYTADELAWAPDGKSIFFAAYKDGVCPVFNIDVATKAVTTVNEAVCDYKGICPLPEGNGVVALRHSILRPNEVVALAAGAPEATALTDINGEVFDKLDMPTVEKRLVATTDGKQMTTWIVKPQQFNAETAYPAILYCQGGPQSAVSQFWSYRWNLALMAANGYVVIAPNRRGLPGFGTEWNAQISGDYGGQNMRDYFAAVDDVKKEPWVDEARIGAVGASYGGFSVYWLAGHHQKRFACFIAHAGIFNLEAQYLETEEMWFANWDMGGAPWDKANATAQRTFTTSPHRFVDQWDTPILVTHGELDFRILASQGMMAFNAARLRGVPAEMLIFPDENHWILKPQNAVLWQRVFFRWLDRWLKPTPAEEKEAAAEGLAE